MEFMRACIILVNGKMQKINAVKKKKVRIGGFAIKHGKQNLLIAFEDIYEFYVEDGYSILFTNQHKKYFPDKSLDKIAEILPRNGSSC